MITIICLNTVAFAISDTDVEDFEKTRSAEYAEFVNDAVMENGESAAGYLENTKIIPYCITIDNTPTHFSTYASSEFYKQLSDIHAYYTLTADRKLFSITYEGFPKKLVAKEEEYPNSFKRFFDAALLAELLSTADVKTLTDMRIALDYKLGTFIMYLNTDKGEYVVLCDEVTGYKFLPDRKLEAFRLYTADEYVDFAKDFINAENEYHKAENEKELKEGYTTVDKNGDDVVIKATPYPDVTKKPQPTAIPKTTSKPVPTPEAMEKPQTTAAPTAMPEALTVKGGDTITVTVGNNAVEFPDAQPFVDENNRTQVPIRAVSEMLNAKVDWSGESKTATITRENGDAVRLTLDSDIMTVNDKQVKMDTAAIIKDDRTYIPVRFVAEALGLTIKWIK